MKLVSSISEKIFYFYLLLIVLAISYTMSTPAFGWLLVAGADWIFDANMFWSYVPIEPGNKESLEAYYWFYTLFCEVIWSEGYVVGYDGAYEATKWTTCIS